jgi:hypothetical protein
LIKLIFLDSLDQLSDDENARNLRWLPFDIPQHVKVVVSTIPDSDCMAVIHQKTTDSEILEVLFVSILFYFVLFCFVLFCFVLFCFVLFCFVLFCFVLFVVA